MFENMEKILENFTTTGGFLTSTANNKTSCMTISWGTTGLFWYKPCFIVGVRPQRYTKTILDVSDSFTVSIPINKMKDELKICGTKSGLDFDKSTVVKYIDSKSVSSKIVDGCDVYFECLIKNKFKFDNDTIPNDVKNRVYPSEDYHILYYGEIISKY